jgi:hypothetical protein
VAPGRVERRTAAPRRPHHRHRLDPDFQRHGVADYQRFLTEAGLTGAFWSLT